MNSSTSARVFLIVLDGFGIGAQPDAAQYGDVGSNTLRSVAAHEDFSVPTLTKLGLWHIVGKGRGAALGSYARLRERACGKDSTTGHWELAGLVLDTPFPTYPQGFPQEILSALQRRCHRGVLCNRAMSGTQALLEYGQAHVQSGDLIVYTSADSVFQIAAHEEIVPRAELYRICQEARALLCGPHAVARVIARPFRGEYPQYERTPHRHDYSLPPVGDTVLDYLLAAGREVLGVGKIFDLFAGRGIREAFPTVSNDDGMQRTLQLAKRDFHGLCFTNLVDFDTLYGHRGDVGGYARALRAFDAQLAQLCATLRPHDVVMVTADHGCDPGFPGSDHTREYVPLLLYGAQVAQNRNLHCRSTFADVGATVAELLGVRGTGAGSSLVNLLRTDGARQGQETVLK